MPVKPLPKRPPTKKERAATAERNFLNAVMGDSDVGWESFQVHISLPTPTYISTIRFFSNQSQKASPRPPANTGTPGGAASPAVPLVWAHGYGCSGAFFADTIRHMLNSDPDGLHYTFDWPGTGRSKRISVNFRDPKHVRDFYTEALESWRSATLGDAPKMHLLGHSFGGYLSVGYCAAYPSRVARLTLLSPIGPSDPRHRLRPS
eukprot:Selendium_serpulae@DN5632_c0_g1_i1.p1